MVHHELLEFGTHKMNFHFIQPIGENILLLGARCRYYETPGPEKNAVIVDAMGNDEKNHIWYYYYTDFNLVKTDLNRDVVYKPKRQNEGFSLFLISKDGRTIIHDGGYNKHFDFFAETIEGERLNGYEGVDFVYNSENLLAKMCSFRSSQAVFVDGQNRLFVKDVVTIA